MDFYEALKMRCDIEMAKHSQITQTKQVSATTIVYVSIAVVG